VRGAQEAAVVEAARAVHRGDYQKPTIRGLATTVRSMIDAFENCYIIINALDECPEREDLLAWIDEILSWNSSKIHLLVTSRELPDIEESLADSVSDHISLSGKEVDDDIRLHIQHQLMNDARLRKWPEDVRGEIEMTLVEGANGM
jgi:ankyrin repeat domain-containing protein 50